MRWRVTSLMNQQFLTATMVLCSVLLHRRAEGLHRDGGGAAEDEGEEVAAALRRARMVWMRRSAACSRKARKAAETASIVLARAGKGRGRIFDSDDGRPPLSRGGGGGAGGLAREGEELLADFAGAGSSR